MWKCAQYLKRRLGYKLEIYTIVVEYTSKMPCRLFVENVECSLN